MLTGVSTLPELEAALSNVNANEPFPTSALRLSRGKKSGTQRVALPEGYLDDLEDASPPPLEAAVAVSGG